MELLQNGNGLLHIAAARKRLKVAEHLIAIGTNIELQNNVRLCEL